MEDIDNRKKTQAWKNGWHAARRGEDKTAPYSRRPLIEAYGAGYRAYMNHPNT